MILAGLIALALAAGDAAPADPNSIDDIGPLPRLSGDVLLSCIVEADGALDDCRVVSESPRSGGLGPYALKIAKRMKLDISRRSVARNIGRRMDVPVRFQLEGSAEPARTPAPEPDNVA
jgi:TonB family protein